MQKQKAIKKMNDLGSKNRPFIFIVDFDINDPIVFELEEAKLNGIEFMIQEGDDEFPEAPDFFFEINPVSKNQYKKAFDLVFKELNYGNSYLLNLTMPTDILTDLSLNDVFKYSRAPFKLIVADKFVVFSPERFVRIEQGLISTFPMKGTINANIQHAESLILSDPKEQAEHATIVDLLRNDLSMVSTNVKVRKYRYVEEVKTHLGQLLQVSSEIVGELSSDYRSKLGSIIFELLPAGSVTGAPKQKTVEIIGEAEKYDRGYFTGIFGYFDGNKLESAVMIRFIESTSRGLIFKSGGGITTQSNMDKEYEEMIDKVYVPII